MAITCAVPQVGVESRMIIIIPPCEVFLMLDFIRL